MEINSKILQILRDHLLPSTSSIHNVNELPSPDIVKAMSLAERNSGELSNETEMFNVSMQGREDGSFISETAHGLLFCVECSMKEEKIENISSKRFVATNYIAEFYLVRKRYFCITSQGWKQTKFSKF